MSLSRLPLCVVCRSFVIIRSNSTYSTYSHHTSVGQFWAHKPAQIVASLNLIGCTNCATFCKCIYVWFLQRALWAQKLASIITPTEGCADPCTIWMKNLELTTTTAWNWDKRTAHVTWSNDDNKFYSRCFHHEHRDNEMNDLGVTSRRFRFKRSNTKWTQQSDAGSYFVGIDAQHFTTCI